MGPSYGKRATDRLNAVINRFTRILRRNKLGTKLRNAISEVLTSVTLMTAVIRGVAPCSLTEMCREQ